MARTIIAPDLDNSRHTALFLAGSINNGASQDWQAQVVEGLKDLPDLVIYNPRRPNWNPNLAEEDEMGLRRQIRWELEHLREADLVFFYFDEAGFSPVSMLELGFCLPVFCPYVKRGNLIVTAHPQAPRRTNLEITLWDFGFPLLSYDAGLNELWKKLKGYPRT